MLHDHQDVGYIEQVVLESVSLSQQIENNQNNYLSNFSSPRREDDDDYDDDDYDDDDDLGNSRGLRNEKFDLFPIDGTPRRLNSK